MWLDWVASPHPGAPSVDESPDDYDHDPVFRGQRIADSSLPDSLRNDAFEDMTPWEMQSYADDLEAAVENESYTDDVVTMVESAVAWLRYWADERKSLYASY